MKTKKKMSKKKKLIIAAISFVTLIIVIVLSALLLIHSYIGKINIVKGSDPVPTITDEQLEPEPADSNEPDSSPSEIKDVDSAIDYFINNSELETKSSTGVFNILLIGIDSRQDNNRGRSDSMMVVSVNKKTKKITVTSIMRDIYVHIPGHKNNRINAAFALGGPDLLMETVSQNFKIKIDRYAYINFFSFIDIVNSVGGVTLDVSQKEIPVINKYITELNKLTGKPESTDFLTKPGKLQLNGKQALGYARNRYVGNSDFERTARQRRVFEQIFQKAKKLSITKLNDLLNEILPDVTTNMPESEIFSYILGAPGYLKYDLEQFRIPLDKAYKGMRVRGMSVLSIDFEKNVKALQDKLYGAE